VEITIKSTEKLTDINGVPVRLWEGVAKSGIKCKVFIHRIAVHKDEDVALFKKELEEQTQPGQYISLRDIL